MNILVTAPTYLPSLDGVAVAVSSQCLMFAALGHQVTVFTQRRAESPADAIDDTIRVQQFRIQGCAHPCLRLAGDLESYRNNVLAGRFDVIVVHAWACATTDALLEIWDQISARVIFCSHGSVITSPRLLWKSPHMLVGWLRYARSVVPFVLKRSAVSVFLADIDNRERFKDVAVAKRICRSRVAFIPNPVDLKLLDDIPKTFDFGLGSNCTCTVVCVGRYTKEKNQLALLRAVTELRGLGIGLVFIGPEYNDYSDALIREWRAKSKGVGGCRVIAGLSRIDTLRAIKSADILVSASKTECQPLVLLEAMAYGIPFLSTNVGCAHLLKGGRVVSSHAEMVSGLRDLVSAPKLRKRMGQAGRVQVEEHFQSLRVIDKVSELISRMSMNDPLINSDTCEAV